MSAWAKFPTGWIIKQKGLSNLSWHLYKSDAIAALLVLMALSIKRNIDNIETKDEEREAGLTGVKATYDEIQALIDISRIKVAKGLAVLKEKGIIWVVPNQRSEYQIKGLDIAGEWAALPQSRLMTHRRIFAFESFTLRTKSELDALKLYLLMIAFRNHKSGFAHLAYGNFHEYAGVSANYVMKAKSHLINLGLITVQQDFDNAKDKTNPPMCYRINGLAK